MHSKYCIVITTTDSVENADLITRVLLEEKLSACIQHVSITSRYRWQSKLVEAQEIKLEIKTKSELFEHVRDTIDRLHIYDVPEIIMLPIERISPSYAQWIDSETVCINCQETKGDDDKSVC